MAYQVKRAATLEAAFALLKQYPGACLIAGGTDRIPRINQGIEHHDTVVCLADIPALKGVKQAEGGISIGPLTKLVELAKEPLLGDYRALQYAAGRVASPQIRNQATAGGNILQENRCVYFNQSVSWRRVEPCFKLGGSRCYQYKGSPRCVALMQSDLAPVLMAHGAGVVFESAGGKRELPLRELYLPAGEKNKQHGEILTEIRLPRPEHALRTAYVRETIRGSFDFPLVSCAVVLEVEGGAIKSAAMAIGSAGDMPKLCEEMGALAGKTLQDLDARRDILVAAGRKLVAPFRDSRVDGAVRRAMGEAVITKALRQVLQQ